MVEQRNFVDCVASLLFQLKQVCACRLYRFMDFFQICFSMLVLSRHFSTLPLHFPQTNMPGNSLSIDMLLMLIPMFEFWAARP